ncbi:MAG TPA: redoxin domain-containing protein, partial [Myxococcales bacterium]|nr:redoxin domain-containing protein [Myxococcales bacterium]
MHFLRVSLIVLTFCATVVPIRAEAKDSFVQRLERWLDEPGTRAVAVEFYSDYCEPCKKAVPQWEALRQRYASKGLKLVVINVDDYESDRQCKTLPWRPDLLICDKGLAEALGVCKSGGSCAVPQAFLWSWQGKRLVSGRAHVAEVEKAVKAALHASPRVLVKVSIKKRGARVDTQLVRRLLEQELSRDLKIQVVVSDKERKALSARAAKTHNLGRTEKQRCELGRDISENMILQADIYSPKRGMGSLSLSLQQITQKCATTVVEDFSDGSLTVSVQ